MSSSNDPGDASAQEHWCRSSLVQDAIHALPGENEIQTDLEIGQRITDIQLIVCQIIPL